MLERIKIWWHTRRQAARDIRNIRKISYPVQVLSRSEGPTPFKVTRLNEAGEPVGPSYSGTFKDGLKMVTAARGTVQNPQDPSPRSRINRHGR